MFFFNYDKKIRNPKTGYYYIIIFNFYLICYNSKKYILSILSNYNLLFILLPGLKKWLTIFYCFFCCNVLHFIISYIL